MHQSRVPPAAIHVAHLATDALWSLDGELSARASVAATSDHIPPDFVVDQSAFDGEGSSNCVFLFPHDVWAMFHRQISEE